MDQDKRRQRELKRALKKAGNKTRRQQLKRIPVDPDELPASESFDFGKYGSKSFNGLDRDATRLRQDEPPHPR